MRPISSWRWATLLECGGPGRHTGLHLFEDLVVAVVVDDNPVPAEPPRPGYWSTVVSSRTLPRIRYELT